MQTASATPEEREDILRFLAANAAASRVTRTLEAAARGDIVAPTLLIARTDVGEPLGIILCQAIPGGNAVIWPPVVFEERHEDDPRRNRERESTEDQLVGAALRLLWTTGSKVVQAFLDPAEFARSAALERGGLRHVTHVWTMRCECRGAVMQPRTPGPGLQFTPFADAAAFRRTLMQTYDATLDVPELNGARTPDEVMAGLAASAPDAARWWLVERAGRPVGVLILADAEEPATWELAYMGVVPEARRRGFGRAILEFALHAAAQARIEHLTLLVDWRNEPALALYRTLGFRVSEVREVFLCIGLQL